jgi:hypothetical protein
MRSRRWRLALLLVASAAQADGPRIWSSGGFDELLLGRPDGVGIAADGSIALGPRAQEIFRSTDDPTLWSVASEPGGSLLVGTGLEARVFRVQSEAGGWRGSQLYDAPELNVTAIAVAADGKAYFTTAPEGALYRLETGAATEIFRPRLPGDRYIWALVLASDGSAFVGTGTEGRIYRVTPAGDGRVFYDSTQTHITALALGPRGELFAGSDGEGLVYRIDGAGNAAVVYDAPLREIHALVSAPRGLLYAAAVGDRALPARPRARRGLPLAPAEPLLPGETPLPLPPAFGEDGSGHFDYPDEPPAAAVRTPASPVQGEVYALESDGTVTTLWSSKDELPLALLLDGEDGLLLGTGDRGRIYRIETAAGTVALQSLLKVDQVTALARAGDGAVIAAGSNTASLFRLDGRAQRGSFTAPVKDAGARASWGAILVDWERSAGAELSVETRSGNGEDPEAGWGPWTAAHAGAAGELRVASGPGRFLQWRATLIGEGSSAPVLRGLEVVYQRLNGKPVLKRVELDPPGRAYPAENAEGAASQPADPIEPAGSKSRSGQTAGPGARFQKGWRALRWEAEDPDGDTLRYSVYLRPQGGREWRLLTEGLVQNRHSFDTSGHADGRYQLRVTASDSESNPAGRARLAAALSPWFTIDNTAPEILNAGVTSQPALLRFRVQDRASPLQRVEVQLEGASWRTLEPVDRWLDDLTEEFEVPLPEAACPAIQIRATDQQHNQATAAPARP